jgi:ATP phosphoribosyltransferase
MSFRLVFAKGRGAAECISLLQHDEIQIPPAFYDGRLTVHQVPRLDLLCLLLRGYDSVNMLRAGQVDAVIGSELLFAEYGGDDLSQAAEFEIGACRFSLITTNAAPAKPLTRVATRYPKLTRRLLGETEPQPAIIEFSGSVETALFLGLSEAIADVVETGQTLKLLSLQEKTVLTTFRHGVWFRREKREFFQRKLADIMPAIAKRMSW